MYGFTGFYAELTLLERSVGKGIQKKERDGGGVALL